MFVAFLSKIFIETKTKCYGYKLINHVFSVAVYDLLPPLDHFSLAFRQKSPGLVSKNLLSQFLKFSSLSKVTPLIWFDKERKR